MGKHRETVQTPPENRAKDITSKVRVDRMVADSNAAHIESQRKPVNPISYQGKHRAS